MKVELGSVVYLKSGGPLMTVEELVNMRMRAARGLLIWQSNANGSRWQHCSLRIRRKPASPLLQRKL